MNTKEPLDICFVSARAYRYLDPDSDRPAGGAQRQQYLIASELRDRGYEVGFVVGDFGQPDEQLVEGIRVFTGCPRSLDGPKGVPAAWWRLYQALKRADASVYYVRGAPRLATATALCCRILDRRFLFCVANDADVDPDQLKDRYRGFVRRGYRWALRRADTIVAQSEAQADSLRDGFGRESSVIPNGYDLPPESAVVPPTDREFVLWVGSSDPDQKRPAAFLELARTLSETEFVMISQPVPGVAYHDQLRRAAADISNLDFLGAVPPDEIHRYYRRASLLVNTSRNEGFPNTFLEAWRYETPIVSLSFDLDGLLSASEPDLGRLAGDERALVRIVEQLVSDPETRGEIGRSSRTYMRERYSLDSVVDEYERILSAFVGE
ncbi:glycosyltransferase family 4 protein [Halosimplex halophilum]|uniref:glycosyltransferase family 4 protein n=1 Tax=Halosimplex halophilum TaxID=2559572 RepID=UPI00107F53FB|nr:glycosyltransferase family 4 protein [Halosimplex halophilum]